MVERETNLDVPWIASVRFLDYASKEDQVMVQNIYRCKPEFLLFPPQTALCKLDGVTEVPRALMQENIATVRDLMNASGPFHLVVTQRLYQYGPVLRAQELNSLELEIALYSTRERVGLLNNLIKKFSSSIRQDPAKYILDENEMQAPDYESMPPQAPVLAPVSNLVQPPCSGPPQDTRPPLLLEASGYSSGSGYMVVEDEGPFTVSWWPENKEEGIPEVMIGDWPCQKCGILCFDWNYACYKCRIPRGNDGEYYADEAF